MKWSDPGGYSRVFERLGVDVQYALSNIRVNDCLAYFSKYDRNFDSLFYDVTGISTGLSESYNYTVVTGIRTFSPLRDLEFSRYIARLKLEDLVAQMTTNKIYSLIAGFAFYPQKVAYRSGPLVIRTPLSEQIIESCTRALRFMRDFGVPQFNYYGEVLKKSIESRSLSLPTVRLAYFGNWLKGCQQGFSHMNEKSNAYFLSFEAQIKRHAPSILSLE